MEDDEDVQIVSKLMEDIWDAVIDYQVSGDPTLLPWAGHIQSESETHCESLKQLFMSMSDGPTGSRSDTFWINIETN